MKYCLLTATSSETTARSDGVGGDCRNDRYSLLVSIKINSLLHLNCAVTS